MVEIRLPFGCTVDVQPSEVEPGVRVRIIGNGIETYPVVTLEWGRGVGEAVGRAVDEWYRDQLSSDWRDQDDDTI